jgi:hypothetical protein
LPPPALAQAGAGAEPAAERAALLGEDAQGLLDVLLATGAQPGDALLAVVQACGREAALPLLAAFLEDLTPKAVVRFLNGFAGTEPVLADGGFQAWARSWVAIGRPWTVWGDLNLSCLPWLSGLPAGLTVEGCLGLESAPFETLPAGLKVYRHLDLRHAAIRRLPDGLDIGGTLNLEGSRLEALPQGLRVGRDLDLTNCPAWDGVIPADAMVVGELCTPVHPRGLPLAHWRLIHPDGEA